MLRYFTYKNSLRYMDVLPKLFTSYNATYHRSIGMSPNADLVQKRLYPLKSLRQAHWHFEPGDHVRMTSSRRNLTFLCMLLCVNI